MIKHFLTTIVLILISLNVQGTNNPITMEEYGCVVVTICNIDENPRERLIPLSVKVEASTTDEALERCGEEAKEEYIKYLKSNSIYNCATMIGLGIY